LDGPIVFQKFDMKTWDWKVRLDPFREKLSKSLIGKPINQIIRFGLNIPLSIIPLSFLDILDSFFGLFGYKNRQCLVAVKKI